MINLSFFRKAPTKFQNTKSYDELKWELPAFLKK